MEPFVTTRSSASSLSFTYIHQTNRTIKVYNDQCVLTDGQHHHRSGGSGSSSSSIVAAVGYGIRKAITQTEHL